MRFWLSEPATVEITLRRAKRTVSARSTVQAPAGTRAAMLRTARLKKGSYSVELRAVDAMGNRAAAATKSVKLQPPASARPPTHGRVATSCATASARSRCCARSPPPRRCAAARPRSPPRGLRAQARSPFEPFQRGLPRVPELLPVSSTRTQDTYEIAIREGMADILPGFQTPIYGYEGVYPGPTIRARKGRKVVVRQRNTLPFESNVHLHGGYVPAGHDGHPMDVIAAGGSFDYHYPNEQDACALWYHDHAHGRTSKTLYYGLLAMYILEDELEAELGLPQGEYDMPLVIADHAFNHDGSFRYSENVYLGFRGDTILVNGAFFFPPPPKPPPPQLLDASNARSYALRHRQRAPDAADRRRRRTALAAGRPPANPVPCRPSASTS